MVKGIYIIRNTRNAKVYVGQTINLNTRWKYHLYLLRKGHHTNKHLQAAFNKYGEKYFKFLILEKTDNLNDREKYWIDVFGGVESKYNYNKSDGGIGGGKRSIETRKKISAWQTGRILSKEHRDNISKSNIGKKHTEQHKIYMSNLYMGRKLLQETKDKISKSKKGVRLSDATRFKLKGLGSKPIIQYDVYGNFIKEFPSAKLAGIELKIIPGDITQCCKGKRKTRGGYVFKYKK